MIAAALRGLPARLAAGSLSRNGLFALGQSLAVMACLFLAFRLVIAEAGLERFGVWSLLLAGSALARIGDVSGGGALARFVAAAAHHGDPRRSRDIVHTVLLTSLILNTALALALWGISPFVLPLVVAPQHMAEAQALVPYAVASMVLGALAVGVNSGIDGTQRADQRAVVVVAASVVFLGFCTFLVPRFGVVGFGAAQLLQQAVMIVLGWLVLRRHLRGIGWLPYRWRRNVFVETTSYAVKLNAIGVAGLMFEPLAKFAFNHSGGPALVALYELASRLVTQVRGLVIASATPLVPAFAARFGPTDPVLRQMLERAMRVAAVAAMGVALVTLAGAPVMSLVVLDRLSPELLGMNAALAAGWSINILVVPLYFAAQALGVLRWNFASHAAIAVSVLIGAFLLVPFFGTTGLILGIVGGLVLSALIVLFGNGHTLVATDIVRRLRPQLLGAVAVIGLMCFVAWIITILAGS